MKGYFTHIETATLQNTDFRKVLYTGKYCQLVLMSLKPQEEIGMEIHTDNDQFFRFEQGEGLCTIDGVDYPVKNGDVIIVPAGASHNIKNISATIELKLYTLYSPPHHKDGIVRATKQDAATHDAPFDGKTTE